MALVLAGCADATDVALRLDGSAPGTGHRQDAGTDTGWAQEGGADVTAPACTAALETLNGRATYVPGSAVAVESQAMDTCVGIVSGADWSGSGDVTVADGTVGSSSMSLVSGAPDGAACRYILRRTSPVAIGGVECVVSRDYALIVP